MHQRMVAVLFFSCISTSAWAAPDALANLAWMQGCWAADKAERGSEEHWMAPAGATMLGISRTVRTGRTVAYEFLRIDLGTDGKAVFTARPSGQPQASFPLLSQDETTVIFENPSHDFPQRIIYRRVGDTGLHARIEGRGKAIDFPMTRKDC